MVVYVGGRLDGRKLLLVWGIEPIILLETEFKEGCWVAHADSVLGIAPNKLCSEILSNTMVVTK